MADKTLTADQARLLTEVVARTTPALKPHEWNDVASKLGIGNGKAAKERFRYLMNSLAGNASKASKTRAAPAISKTPATAPSTPSKKRKTANEGDVLSAKKIRTKLVKPTFDDDGEEEEEEEEEEEQELITPIEMQTQLNTQEKQQLQMYGSSDTFSFFDLAAYQQDRI